MTLASGGHRRTAAKFAIDLVLWSLAAPAAFALRLDADVDPFMDVLLVYVAIGLPVKAAAVYFFDLHRQSWRSVGIRDLSDVVLAIAVVSFVLFGLGLILYARDTGMPRTVPLIEGVLALLALGGVRLFARRLFERRAKGRAASGSRVLVAGAGEAGAMLVREMQRHPESGLLPVAFVDDDRAKLRRRFVGLEVVGTFDDIPRLVERGRIGEVLIAMPSAPGATVRRVIDRARQAPVAFRILPGVYELLTGKVGLAEIRDVRLDDLLRRDPIQMQTSEVESAIRDKVVLVTGAGGSIGSELVRQIAPFGPRQVLLLGHGENSVDAIARELSATWPTLDHRPVIGSIRDERKMDDVFARFRPHVVLHAAAHKHVPLMEHDADEAVLNNVAGTRVVAEAALRHGAERFVNISTDKAVDPRSVLGATKFLAEVVVRELSKRCPPTQAFVSVRFGNVLGSRGSVVPLFEQQIRAGGPVTITHPDMSRFLMTIPEASQLVVQATGLAHNGAVYVLDMGEPVKMLDLARDMIQLHGYRVGDDIDIEYTGVRPGEKMHEALFNDWERPVATSHEKILMARDEGTHGASMEQIEVLVDAARARDRDGMFALLRRLTPSYVPWGREDAPVEPPAPAEGAV